MTKPPRTLQEVLTQNRALVAAAPAGVRAVYKMNREFEASRQEGTTPAKAGVRGGNAVTKRPMRLRVSDMKPGQFFLLERGAIMMRIVAHVRGGNVVYITGPSSEGYCTELHGEYTLCDINGNIEYEEDPRTPLKELTPGTQFRFSPDAKCLYTVLEDRTSGRDADLALAYTDGTVVWSMGDCLVYKVE